MVIKKLTSLIEKRREKIADKIIQKEKIGVIQAKRRDEKS